MGWLGLAWNERGVPERRWRDWWRFCSQWLLRDTGEMQARHRRDTANGVEALRQVWRGCRGTLWPQLTV